MRASLSERRASALPLPLPNVAPQQRDTQKPDSFSAASGLPRFDLLVLALRGVDGMMAVAPRQRGTIKPESFSVASVLLRFDLPVLALRGVDGMRSF